MTTETIERPGIRVEELPDHGQDIPCEMLYVALGRLIWKCRRKSKYRARIHCGSCDRPDTAFYCGPHTKILQAGLASCKYCLSRLDYLGML